jgi:S-DNA-T family DNA segregation ATPase FtsK/SpoIIIE
MPDEPPNLPAVPDPAALAEDVVDGEIVDDPEPSAPRPAVVQVFQTITIVINHPAARVTARHASYPLAGLVVLWRRRRRGRSLALDFAQQARAQGDHANGLLWAQHHEAAINARHERRKERARLAVDLLKASPWLLGAWAFLMLAAGCLLAWAHRDPADVLWPWKTLADTVADLVAVVPLAAAALAVALPAGLLIALHEAGRRGGDLAPGWAVASATAEEERGLVVTADGIVVALQNLPIPELKKAFKDSWQPAFRLTPVKDGEGYSAVFSVPMGVTPEMIADKNEVFARNLHRAKVEVWPTDAERDGVAAAGFVNLWVADPGVLDRPAPEWPLLNEGAADVFKGVPAGVTARGRPVLIPIVGNNFSIGGLMGQGKSNACRVVMLGAALDPLAELQVHVFAYNGDFDCFEPRLRRYVKGAEEEQIDAAMATLAELQAELGVREQIIADLGAKKVTRQLAERHPQLRPRLTLFSECHELFGHKDHGDEATEIATAVERRARKLALWLGFDTQDARKDAIPPKLLSLVSIRSCLPVTSWRANDGFLWDGAFKSGVRATELRAGRDIGRSITTGVSNEQFEILKWHYIFSDDDTGADDAAPVIARSMRQLAPGTSTAGALLQAAEVRDLLDDLAEVIDGPGRVRVADLPPMLRRLARSWGPYRALSGTQLRERLLAEGVRTTNPGNVPMLDPAELARAIAERGVS